MKTSTKLSIFQSIYLVIAVAEWIHPGKENLFWTFIILTSIFTAVHNLSKMIEEKREKEEAAKSLLADMVYQFAHRNDKDEYYTGGMSVLEDTFKYFDLSDPCSIEELERKLK